MTCACQRAKEPLRVRGKGGKPRDLPIHAQLRTDLQAWLDERPDWPGAGTSPALLLNRRGRRLSVRGASDIIRSVAAEANLDEERITAHIGRIPSPLPSSGAAPTSSPSLTCSATSASTPFASTPTPPSPAANEPSISCHMTAD
jgi:hypothetical protein